MDYFNELRRALQLEKDEDRRTHEAMLQNLSVIQRRNSGLTWYPVAIRDSEAGKGDYLTVELERTTHHELIHQFRFGAAAALFSNHDPSSDRIEGIVVSISGNKLRLSLRVDEMPDWASDGKLGLDIVFDANSYQEMERALNLAPLLAEKREEGKLVRVLIGQEKPGVQSFNVPDNPLLNEDQEKAVATILSANELAIVHGPPGTGKTTTLVQAIKALIKLEAKQILVTAPSNAAVDLLSERISEAGLNVVRVGNSVRVSEHLQALTLDSRMTEHAAIKETRKLKKQATAYRDLAGKYKRSFGKEEREQRKALLAEARSIAKEIEKTEQYVVEDILSRAQVITATLVGASHYTIRERSYDTVVIDEAGQALEPACWIPITKAKRLVLAGDHKQLPPTVKSVEAAKEGLEITLLEKLVPHYPECVVLLRRQYRMHDTIMNFSSSVFYEGRLEADESVAGHLVHPEFPPLSFIDTAGCGFEEKTDDSGISNPEEASFLVSHLSETIPHLKAHYGEEGFPTIGVVSPYRHQVEILKELVGQSMILKDISASLSVNTIDSFQGQERDVIYISLVRSNNDQTIGFLSEIRRMNVAMTRAKKRLVIIGDSGTLSQHPFYSEFISFAQQRDSYQSAWEFMHF